jgi:hypothetical protein
VQGPFPEAQEVTLRRDTIVTALAGLVIVAAIPFAVVDTIETGRVYLFSRQFLGIHREAWCPLNREKFEPP